MRPLYASTFDAAARIVRLLTVGRVTLAPDITTVCTVTGQPVRPGFAVSVEGDRFTIAPTTENKPQTTETP
jgi:hypothetical protein